VGLSSHLAFGLEFFEALTLSAAVAFAGTFLAMPRILDKLRGAGITGRDINKPERPEIPEMGGIGVFLGFYTGVFAYLFLDPQLVPVEQVLILVALITAAGAAMTGVIDDLVELRQHFKAFIPIVFAAPLAMFVQDYTIALPFVGVVDFGLVYPFVLVPLGIACASNGFNMLEGYNGLGAGLGIIMALTMSILAMLHGGYTALILLIPLAAALIAFLYFNWYPAKIFPGDTMTLLVGAVLAAAAMIGKFEFWGAILFVPHVLEFFLKARGSFEAENFAKRFVHNPHDPPRLEYEGPTESLTHVVLKRLHPTEPMVTVVLWGVQIALGVLVVAAYLASA